MKKIGLVLEGGGMRGIFTSGVIDAFIDHHIEFEYIIGVSAGANNGSNYISKQRSRGKRILYEWSQDKRFIGLYSLFHEGSFFGMNFIFDKLSNELDPFDYDSFCKSSVIFKVGASNCDTGNAAYFEKHALCSKEFVGKNLRASCSLPILSPAVRIGKYRYLDGALTNPIPLDQSIKDGNELNVIVLTKQVEEGAKLTFMDHLFMGMSILRYPKLKTSILDSKNKYKESIKKAYQLQDEGKAIVLVPQEQLLSSRYAKNQKELLAMYQQGYQEAIHQMKRLKKWMQNN